MPFVKLDENNIVVEKQLSKRPGYMEVPDSVVCGMQYTGKKWRSPPPPPVPYDQQRLREHHTPVGDQLDAEFKARQKRKLLVGQARELLKSTAIDVVTKNILSLILEAIEPTQEQNVIDAHLQGIKDKHPKP